MRGMNGLIRKAVAALAPAALLAGLAGYPTCDAGCGDLVNGHNGCNGHHGHWDCYDHCYPQRYWYTSQREVNAAFAPQVLNGHVLDQTVWNHDFEPGSDVLTPGGLEHLNYLARRRPQPDTCVYVATAHDLAYDPACPDHLAGARQELDTRRVQAVQKYLAAVTAGRPADFQVLVHDPSDPTIMAIPAGTAVQKMYLGFQGILPRAGSGGGTASGGAGAR